MTAFGIALLIVAAAYAWEYRGEIFGSGVPAEPEEDGGLFEFPLPDGWTERDVLVTVAEIASL